MDSKTVVAGVNGVGGAALVTASGVLLDRVEWLGADGRYYSAETPAELTERLARSGAPVSGSVVAYDYQDNMIAV
jgi:hypothetical protein